MGGGGTGKPPGPLLADPRPARCWDRPRHARAPRFARLYAGTGRALGGTNQASCTEPTGGQGPSRGSPAGPHDAPAGGGRDTVSPWGPEALKAGSSSPHRSVGPQTRFAVTPFSTAEGALPPAGVSDEGPRGGPCPADRCERPGDAVSEDRGEGMGREAITHRRVPRCSGVMAL